MDEHATTRRGALLAAALTAPALKAASAQDAQTPSGLPSPAATSARTARANAGTVGVISGGVDGTYIRIAADLGAVLDNGDQLRVLALLGKGSVQNIADILYLRGIDIGIVQSDVLAYARAQRLFPGVTQLVHYITKLYDEEVHILARRDIQRVQDLAGKPVNVDVQGSGTALTASLIFASLGLDVTMTHHPQDTALERLRQGEIAALMYVAGKPARLFTAIPAGSDLHFLPLPLTPALLETYLPAELAQAQYPNLVPEGRPVETVAVGAVMATYAWQPGTERYRKVSRFVEAFNAQFDTFLRPPRHPKWREVNLRAQVPGWTRFQAG